MIYFLILAISDVLFASQFLFNQKFEAQCGSSFTSSMLFSLYTSLFGFTVLFAANRFELKFSLFSFFIAFLYAVTGILYTVASVKSFEEVNLSTYSVFAMLGGMLLPSLYGIVFCEESVNAIKLVCYVLIIAALFFSADFNKKTNKKFYYAAVFVLNGLTGVLSVIHQSVDNFVSVDSFSFLMLARLSAAVLSIGFIAKKPKHAVQLTNIKALLLSLGFALFSTVGNLLLLISLKHISASVQYPFVTGGVMLVSLIISIARKENVTQKNLVATTIAFASTICLSLGA